MEGIDYGVNYDLRQLAQRQSRGKVKGFGMLFKILYLKLPSVVKNMSSYEVLKAVLLCSDYIHTQSIARRTASLVFKLLKCNEELCCLNFR